jgi:hypothetical protein
MGTDIQGWVEVPKFDYWRGVIKIDGLMYRNYLMFEFLFGVRNRSFPSPIAERRGIPRDHSSEVRKDESFLEDARDHSCILWEELKAIQWADVPRVEVTYDWRLLFRMMEMLAQEEHIGPAKIRLLVAFF